MLRVGFSGTREGMVNDQLLGVHMLLGDLRAVGAHQASHGLCEGSDEQFHDMARALGYFIIGCPGVTMAWHPLCRSTRVCDLVKPERPFIARNHDIVRESDVMIATPAQKNEQGRGSGTWATIRFARQQRKSLVIFWPDGTSLVEYVPGVSTAEEYRHSLLRQLKPQSI